MHHIAIAGLSRADVAESERKDFYLYLDELHTFTTLAFANMLSKLRKYRIGLILANQYLCQLKPEVRDSLVGNVGTVILFRFGAKDARFFAEEFSPKITAQDFINLPKFQIYLGVMTDGAVSKPFSAQTVASLKEFWTTRKGSGGASLGNSIPPIS